MHSEKYPKLSVIVPTLNEEEHIGNLLYSIKKQNVLTETLIVDGGSKDSTGSIANKYNAEFLFLPRHGEFISRNIGAKNAKSELLLFTCADVIFPENLFQRIVKKFEKNPKLIALTGPGHPFDAPLLGKIEYAIYNFIRYIFVKLPKPLKRFSTSTNFLVVRKKYFETTGGFVIDDINADGLMGKALLELGEVNFFLNTFFFLSARRMKSMGFLNFNKHYLYALENFFYSFSKTGILSRLKDRSKQKHRKLHER